MKLTMIMSGLLISLSMFATPAVAQTSFDPRSYQDTLAGEPTEILVLGTMHLGGLDDDWDRSTLDPLIDRLAMFNPDVIAIEGLSGQAIAALWNYKSLHGNTARSYGRHALRISMAAQLSTGLTMAEAEAEVRDRLLQWPDSPTATERRELAARFVAAGEPYSALVQWFALPTEDRIAEDDISEFLRLRLDELAERQNENNLIGSRLAAQLGLNRVHAIDSQDEAVFAGDESAEFGRLVFKPMAAAMRANPVLQPVFNPGDMNDVDAFMDRYRMVNTKTIGQGIADGEWGSIIDGPDPSDLARMRIAGWEIRNLRMAANIRQASARSPGGRVLVIVGFGHKTWLEAYLSMMSDVRIVDAGEILK